MADADVNHEKIEDKEKGEKNHDATPKGAGASVDRDKGSDEKEAKQDNGAGQKDAVADSGDAQGGQEEGGKKSSKLATQFKAFSKFGDTKSDGRKLTLSQSDKWMKQAKVIDGKTVTTTDTGIYFKKFKCQKITFVEFEKYLDEIAKGKKMDAGEIRNKMTKCGPPGFSGTTNAVKTSAVDRLTDASRYTGSHKLRFDEKGRGRGIAGRKDVADKSGYVQGYSNKETYNKTH